MSSYDYIVDLCKLQNEIGQCQGLLAHHNQINTTQAYKQQKKPKPEADKELTPVSKASNG